MSVTGFSADLGGTKIAAARIENGVVVDRLQEPTVPGGDAETQLDHIMGLLDRLGFAPGAALGLAVTGRVTSDGKWSAVNTGTLPKIDEVPLGRLARSRLGPLKVGNDALAACLAEGHLGAGRGTDTFAYLTVSTGVGGGLVLDGRPVIGGDGLAGHLGFVTSPHATALCGSGRYGTVESVAGGRAIAAAAGSRAEDARAVFAAANAGEGWADVIIARSAAAVATLAADLRASLGVTRIVLGGSIGLAPGYLERVVKGVAHEPALFRPEVMPAELGADSALLGALLLSAPEGS